MKVSLTLKGGTKVETENGTVEVFGGSVTLQDEHDKLVIGYRMNQGEIVRKIGEGEYIVEF